MNFLVRIFFKFIVSLNNEKAILTILELTKYLDNIGKFKDSILYYNIYLNKFPDDVQILYRRGLAFYSTLEYEKALYDLTRCADLEMKKHNSIITKEHIYTTRGLIYMKMNLFDKGFQDFDLAYNNSNSMKALLHRGICSFELKNFDSALTDFNKTIDSGYNSELSFSSRASIYFMKKDFKSALQDINQSISFEKENPDSYYQRGLIYFYEGSFEKALIDFQKTLKLEKNHKLAEKYKKLSLENL
jgi:tetratricopeptide (TPR) repeat protein